MFRQIAAFALLVLPAVACAQVPASTPASAPASVSASVWTNDHARLVIQSVGPDGRLSGTYQNFGSHFSCAGIVYPVTGWLDGDRISYTALRKDQRNCTAMESWLGTIRGNELVVEFIALGSQGS
jgi:hypothetical protein